MSRPLVGALVLISRVYPVLALLVCAMLLPPGYFAITLPLLGLYVYAGLRWSRRTMPVLLTLFLVFALPMLFTPIIRGWPAFLVAVPILPLFDDNLKQLARRQKFEPGGKGRRPTTLLLLLAASVAAVGAAGWAFGNNVLLLSCSLVGVYLAAIVVLVFTRTWAAPARAEVVTRRALAGQLTEAPTRLIKASVVAGQLRLKSPHPWMSIKPDWFVMEGQSAEIEVDFTPPLAGPASLVCDAAFLDQWGLMQVNFQVTLADLLVVPRAKYAQWLARRYLTMSRSGTREAMSSTAAAQRTTRKGIEFYGIRVYQPGDSAKTIDWKHALKLHRLVVREFLDSGVESSVLLVNLAVMDDEDSDKLAYSLVMTALTLARESIPSVIAAYDDRDVLMTSRLLDPREALLQALSLTKQIKRSLAPLRYLQTPDVARLRANIHRLRGSNRQASSRLAELLQLEYSALSKASLENPATRALNAALSKNNARVNVLTVSRHNHDAEALAFARYSLTQRGYRVLNPELLGG